jgi:hypothetical protein
VDTRQDWMDMEPVPVQPAAQPGVFYAVGRKLSLEWLASTITNLGVSRGS